MRITIVYDDKTVHHDEASGKNLLLLAIEEFEREKLRKMFPGYYTRAIIRDVWIPGWKHPTILMDLDVKDAIRCRRNGELYLREEVYTAQVYYYLKKWIKRGYVLDVID